MADLSERALGEAIRLDNAVRRLRTVLDTVSRAVAEELMFPPQEADAQTVIEAAGVVAIAIIKLAVVSRLDEAKEKRDGE